jgi:hypothetical protein
MCSLPHHVEHMLRMHIVHTLCLAVSVMRYEGGNGRPPRGAPDLCEPLEDVWVLVGHLCGAGARVQRAAVGTDT